MSAYRRGSSVVLVIARLPLTNAGVKTMEAYLRLRAVDLTTLHLQFEGVAGLQDGKAVLFQTLARLSYPRLAELHLDMPLTCADMARIGTMLRAAQWPQLRNVDLTGSSYEKNDEALRDLLMFLRGCLHGKLAIGVAGCVLVLRPLVADGSSVDADATPSEPELIRLQKRKHCTQCCRLARRHDASFQCSWCKKYMCNKYFRSHEPCFTVQGSTVASLEREREIEVRV